MRYFLSHAGPDREQALALAEGLKSAGLQIWCDALPDAIPTGTSWVQALEDGLESSSGYLLLVGSSKISGWVKVELDYALNRQARQRDFRLVPLLLPEVEIHDLPPLLGRFQALRLEDHPTALGTAGFAGLKKRLEFHNESEAPLVDAGACPFPGLDAFDEDQARFFFGRDQETREIVKTLGSTSSGYRRWLQIEGASGSGKSSLARAGLLPAVRRGWLDQRRNDWRIATVRPGHDPLRNLARRVRQQFAKSDTPDLETILTHWRSSRKALEDFLEEHLAPRESFLLLIDQLEEAFTLSGAADLSKFDEILATALASGDSRLHLVTTIRSDLLGQFSKIPQLESLLNTHASRYYLAQMGKRALTEVVLGPACMAGLSWERPELPIQIVQDTMNAPGGLPLLGYALLALWKKRDHNILIEDVYLTLGGVGGALVGEADALMAQLARRTEKSVRDDHRAWNLLLELIQTNERAQETRRVISRADALAAAGGGAAAERVLLLLSGQRAADAPTTSPLPVRLVVVSGESRVELAHEELLRSWKSLRNKIQENRRQLECRERLESAVESWVAAGRPPGDLPGARMLAYYRGARPTDRNALEFLRRGHIRLLRRRMIVSAFVVAIVILGISQAKVRMQALQKRGFHLEIAYQLTELESLREEADELLPGAPDGTQRIRSWLAEADSLRNSYDELISNAVIGSPFVGEEFLPGDYSQIRENARRLHTGVQEMFSTGVLVELVQRSLELAEAADRRAARTPEEVWRVRWEEVEQTIREGIKCPKYGHQPISPRRDLYPLRINQEGLWEMVHLRSGEVPTIEPSTRHLQTGQGSGLVFVLVPGGRFHMGAQKEDEAQPNFDPSADSARESPIRSVVVGPYYLSKYEMTRGQWYRVTGRPVAREDSRPLGLVSWNEIAATLPALGMALPTEEQWEYATRAGTGTRYWSGKNDPDLDKAGWHSGNADANPLNEKERPLPVGLLDANPFGLHDVHGNVWELCQNLYTEGGKPSREVPEFVQPRVMRGGSYMTAPKLARSSARTWFHPSSPAGNVGVRPALALTLQ